MSDDKKKKTPKKKDEREALSSFSFNTSFLTPLMEQGSDLGSIERILRDRVLEESARTLETKLNEEILQHPAPMVCPRCGRALVDKGIKPKEITTLFGTITVRRRYGYCPHCKKGDYPDGRRLGLDASGLSPEVKRLSGLFGGETDFARGSELLWEASRIRLSSRQLQRVAERLGEEIEQEEEADVSPDHHPRPFGRTIYVGMDGTGIPMQARETRGRRGKQADGSSKTREAKMCDIGEANRRSKKNLPIKDPGSVTYTASIESAAQKDTDQERSAFARRVEREATRRGVATAARLVVIGDGASWIWNLAGELFPQVICIVDRFHAKQHLSTLSKELFGPTSAKGALWTQERYEELDEGRMDDLLKSLAIYATTFPEAKRCRAYFENDRERMRYPEFRAQGLSTSSGVVEGGCKSVVGGRLKKSGMHWSIRGANSILALRCSIKSGRYATFWKRRMERRAA